MTQTGIGLNRGVGLIRATSRDIDLLTDSEARTFADDGRPRGAPRSEPAGHRSRAWHRKMIANTYFYKITLAGEVVGGLVVARLGWHHFHLVRMWVDPAHQGQGVGSRALALLEAARPHVTLWTVDAPAWAHRRRHFYEANGYRATREVTGTVQYARRRRGVLRLPPSLP